MIKVHRTLLPLLVLAVFGHSAMADVLRTSSPTERGLTEADFPRIQNIAEVSKAPITHVVIGSDHGDLFVHLPQQKILFTSEVFLNHMFSGFRSAYTQEWIVAIERAERLAPERYIPGHGFIDNKAVLDEEWVAHKEHVQFVFDAVSAMHAAGLSVDEAVEQADWGPYSDWSGAEFQGRIAIKRIYPELNGELQ